MGEDGKQRFLIEILSDNNLLTRGVVDLSETIFSAESLAKAYMDKILSTASYYSTNTCCITPNLSLADLGYKEGLKYLCISFSKDVKTEGGKTYKETIGQYMSYSVPAYVPAVLLMLCVATYKPMPEEVCYAQIGCLSLEAPWTERPLVFNFVPQPPAAINTSFIITSRELEKGYRIEATAKDPDVSAFDWSKNLNIIVHGFTDNATKWVQNMAYSLLANEDVNVLAVDWTTGADMYYPQSVANARVVAAQVTLFLDYITETKRQELGEIHIIGHSLGAHIAGYIGKRYKGIRKITGLDPAAPLFDGFHQDLRLFKTDAEEVVVLHTNIAPMGFGIREPLGTTDIYINDGQDQFGCIPMLDLLLSPPTMERLQGMRENIACSHRRAYEIYSEAILSRYPLKAYPCSSWDSIERESCASMCENKDGCHSVGLKRITKTAEPSNLGGHDLFYMPTSNNFPYCITHVRITAKTCSDQKPMFNVRIFAGFSSLSVAIHEGMLRANQKVSKLVSVQCGITHQSVIQLTVDIKSDEAFLEVPQACFSYIKMSYLDPNDELITLTVEDIRIDAGQCGMAEFTNNMFAFYVFRDSVLEYINKINVVLPFYNPFDFEINKMLYQSP